MRVFIGGLGSTGVGIPPEVPELETAQATGRLSPHRVSGAFRAGASNPVPCTELRGLPQRLLPAGSSSPSDAGYSTSNFFSVCQICEVFKNITLPFIIHNLPLSLSLDTFILRFAQSSNDTFNNSSLYLFDTLGFTKWSHSLLSSI